MALPGVREQFPALGELVYLNCGGMAPLPRSVAEEWLRLPRFVAEHGPLQLQLHDEAFVRSEEARAALAALTGAEPAELTFTTQFSTGVSLVAEGLAWRDGDEIAVSDQEHPALLTPLLNIARRRGLRLRRFAVSNDPAAMLDGLAAVLSGRTRLLAVSHITTETGTPLPVAEMAALARERGALVLVDGAHSLGQWPLDLRALDCDFYAMVGYKWLFGPYPSAALFIRRAALDQVDVTWTGSRVSTTARIDMDALDFVPGAGRFEYGGRPFAHDSAMGVGARLVADLGVAEVLAHARRLAAHLQATLARLPGVRVHSPANPADGAGIVTFSLAGMAGTRLSAGLLERWSIVTRPALAGAAVRVSIAAFTSEEDLDRLVDGAATLAAGR